MMKFTIPIKCSKTPIKKPNGHWDFPEAMDTRGYVGFIYVLFDTYLKRAYLGKKFYRGNGVKNKGVESDWKKYISSSKVMKEIFAERPRDEFEFICLEQYKMRGALSYAETWSLCFVEAPTSEQWYNTRIEKVSWNVNEPVSDRHKCRLNEVLERMNAE
jgi:hypothetical protein